MTLRLNTERPITLTYVTNKLVGISEETIQLSAEEILAGR
jgi:UDP-N-acetylglucosamine 2-epimerase